MAILTSSRPAFAQDEGQEFMIPMRDGVHLKTTLFFPDGQGPWPLVLERTQFGTEEQQFRTFPDYYKTGAIWAIQNTRGRNGSEGDRVPVYDTDGWGTLQDGYDTCAWFVRQAWCNGRIGTIGGSARGGYAHLLSAVNAPGLEAVFVRDGLANLWESILFTDGAWRFADSQWYAQHGDINRLYEHPAFDETWAPFDTTTRSNVRDHAITYEVGWFDAFRQGSMHAWRDLQLYGTARARAESKLALEARGHIAIDQWLATQPWPASATVPPLAYQGRALFDHYLKGEENGYPDLPKVTYYLMGNIDTIGQTGPGNEWHAVDEWPPPVRWVPLYLQGDGKLTPVPFYPEPGSLSYDYNPKDPVPTIGGSALFQGQPGMYDQREIESRGDVLTFETEPLSAPLEVTGPIRATLFASSDRVDTDFVVKVTDVYPDGRSMVVTDGIMRASYRDSLSEPTPLEPGTVYRFDVRVWDTAMLFDARHRIRITIMSSNYPRYAANPNTGAGPSAVRGETLIARNTIHLSSEYPSHIEIPVRERGDASVLWGAFQGNTPALRVANMVGFARDVVDVPISVERAGAWDALSFEVRHDPGKLTVNNVTLGEAVAGWSIDTRNIAPGRLAVTATRGAGASAAVPGPMFRINTAPREEDVDVWIDLLPTGENPFSPLLYSGRMTVLDPARIKPAVTLLGEKTMTVECRSDFNDPGAVATDPQDGELRDVLVFGGDFSTDMLRGNRVIYAARDSDGNLSEPVIREVFVVDTTPPEITLNGTDTVVLPCGEPYVDAGATARDVCRGTVPITGNIPAIETPGTYTVTYTAVDPSGNSATKTRTVRVVDNAPPVLGGAGLVDQSIPCGTSVGAAIITATDACDGSLAATLTGAVNIDTPGTYTQTINAVDAAGNRATRTRRVTVTDFIPPEIMLNGPEVVEIECGDAYFEPGVTATDNCAGSVTVEVEGNLPRPTPVGDYVRTYRARDAAGNTATAVRTLRVRDTKGPSVRIAGQTSARVACGERYVDPGATALDDCSGTTAVTVSGTLDTKVPGEYVVTYNATDGGGNTASASRTVTVFDAAPPVVHLNGASRIEITCDEIFLDPGANAVDACSGDVPVTRTPSNVNTGASGTRELVYHAVDDAGNSATATRTLVVLPCEVGEGEGSIEGNEGEGEGAPEGEGEGEVPNPACGCANSLDKGARDLMGDLFLGLLTFGVLLACTPIWRNRM